MRSKEGAESSDPTLQARQKRACGYAEYVAFKAMPRCKSHLRLLKFDQHIEFRLPQKRSPADRKTARREISIVLATKCDTNSPSKHDRLSQWMK